VFAFSRLLVTSRVRFLYLACAAVGLAFYCKEHAALVLPVLLATLLLPRYRHWFRSPHLYLALGTFVLIIGVDLIWNLTVDSRRAQVSYAGETVAQATYASHLKRIGGLGLSPYPAMFYGHTAVMAAHRAIVGSELTDETPEYDAVDAVLGLLLVSAVAIVTVQSVSRTNRATNAGAVFLLLLFWGIFGFFTLIKKGSPPGRLDPVSWIWVEVTIIPAAILTASWLASVTSGWRIVLWAFAASVLVYASAAPALALVRRGVGAARELLSQSSHMVQLLVMWFVDAVRLHPLRVTTIVFALGVVVGAILGYLVALRVRRRLSAGHESPTS
jgi:4-amino-4-deoxy-L-arabinose transferase-like glycosyltransferase